MKILLNISLVVAVLLVPAVVFGATTVGNDVSVGGTLDVTGATTITNVSSTNHSASGYLDVNGATTLDGAVTLGDAYADNITVTGRIASALWASSTLYIGSAGGGEDLVVTNNAITVGTTVNSSTLAVYGNTTLTGSLLSQTGHNNLYDLGAFGSAWNDIFVSGTLYLNTLSLTGASSEFAVTNVSSTNMSASGYLDVNGATTLDGNVTLGNAVTDSITAMGFFLDTISVGDGAAVTSTLNNDSFSVAKNATNNVGKFYVDSSGSISASGTIQTLQLATSTIIIDTTDVTKGTCFVVRDVAGTAKYMTILAGNTVGISTVDCRL